MLISHRKKFIYTKTVKTAGTSVESYFEKYCMPEGEWEFSHHRDQYVSDTGIIGARGPDAVGSEWFNHMPAIDIRNRMGAETWDSYFKFCVIRNPFEKLVSMFFFRKEKGVLGVGDNGDPVEGFRKWVGKEVPVPDRTQYTIDGTICIDYFIRYEDLENGVSAVCDRLRLPFRPERIPSLKSGIRDRSIPVECFYSADLIQSVANVYEFEIKEFGYDFGSFLLN